MLNNAVLQVDRWFGTTVILPHISVSKGEGSPKWHHLKEADRHHEDKW